MEASREELGRFFERVLPHLNEVQRRVVAGWASSRRSGCVALVVATSRRSTNSPVCLRANVHDFADRRLGEFAKAIPYGVYDIGNDEGWVAVGDSADTSEFAVEAIQRWWNTHGRHRFPNATTLTITADAGGSNGYRIRAWKWHLARLAADTVLTITVMHYPPGTSKWNKIEHRLFSFISMNWRGRSLTDTQFNAIPIAPHERHGDWNYTITA